MSLHNEIEFENEICGHLAAHGWLYVDGEYDRARALFPADVLAWVQETQTKAWDALVKNHGAQAAETLLTRLRQSLDQRGMSALEAHTTMSTQALNSEAVREGLKAVLLGPAQLYETLRGQSS